MPAEKTAERLASQVRSLPTLPAVLSELSRRMEDPNTSSEDLAHVIIQDQAIASKVLKLVNSPFYGYSGKIHTITQGIVILGFNAVKNLVLSTSVIDSFKATASNEHFSLEQMWIHSASVASVARLLAEKKHLCDPEEAFVTGLLHDIGKVLLWVSEQETFTQCLMLASLDRSSLSGHEKNCLGFTNSDLASLLAERWKFPESLREALRYHHTPMLAPNQKGLAAVVHCSNTLCTAMGFAATPQAILSTPDMAAWELVGLQDDEFLREILVDLPPRLQAAATFVTSAL